MCWRWRYTPLFRVLESRHEAGVGQKPLATGKGFPGCDGGVFDVRVVYLVGEDCAEQSDAYIGHDTNTLFLR